MLGKGKTVKAKRDLKWKGETIKSGTKGVIVAEAMFTPKFTVTFTGVGWSNKSVTLEDLTRDDIQES